MGVRYQLHIPTALQKGEGEPYFSLKGIFSENQRLSGQFQNEKKNTLCLPETSTLSNSFKNF